MKQKNKSKKMSPPSLPPTPSLLPTPEFTVNVEEFLRPETPSRAGLPTAKPAKPAKSLHERYQEACAIHPPAKPKMSSDEARERHIAHVATLS